MRFWYLEHPWPVSRPNNCSAWTCPVESYRTDHRRPWDWCSPQGQHKVWYVLFLALYFLRYVFVPVTPCLPQLKYSLITAQVLTGENPWSNLDINETELEQYRMKNPDAIQTRPSDITNDEHWALMLKCWRKEPTLRPTANMALSSMATFLK